MTRPGTVQHHARPGHHRPPWPRKERTTSATSQPTMAPKWARHTHTHAHQRAQNNGPKWAKRTHTHTCTQPPPPPPPPTSKADKDGMGDWQGMVAPTKQNIKPKRGKGDLSCRYLSLYIYPIDIKGAAAYRQTNDVYVYACVYVNNDFSACRRF